jgi:hypothetical protein
MSDVKTMVNVVKGGKLVGDVLALAAGVGALTNPVCGFVALAIAAPVLAFRAGETVAELVDNHQKSAASHTNEPSTEAASSTRFGMFAQPNRASAVAKSADKVLEEAPVVVPVTRENH